MRVQEPCVYSLFKFLVRFMGPNVHRATDYYGYGVKVDPKCFWWIHFVHTNYFNRYNRPVNFFCNYRKTAKKFMHLAIGVRAPSGNIIRSHGFAFTRLIASTSGAHAFYGAGSIYQNGIAG